MPLYEALAESVTLSIFGNDEAKHKAKAISPLLVGRPKARGLFLMVRRYGKLYEQVCSMDNLRLAFQKASRNKRKYTEVIDYEKNLEENLKILQNELITKTYHTGEYRQKTIYEPKERIIYILKFKHRVAQWALMNIVEPIIIPMLIKDTYSCIVGRGMHKASERTMEYVARCDYCLKMDIRKFYPSVNQSILYSFIERKFKDKDLLYLFKDIIFSFPGGKNMPIGNLASQILGNFYMNALDRFVTEELGCKYYARYCDDFCLFSNDKKQLHYFKQRIINFLREKLDLQLSKCDIFPVSRGVDFMGYRHFRGYRLVRKSTAKRVKRRIPAVYRKLEDGKISFEQFRSIIDSTLGWVEWANSYNFIKSTKILEYRSKAMAKFSEIAEENDKNLRKLEGESVKIDEWVNKPIKITNYRVEPSNFKDKYGRTKNRIGFEFYYEGTPRVIFTSASTLLYLIPKYCRKDEPLECKIVKKSDGQYVLE